MMSHRNRGSKNLYMPSRPAGGQVRNFSHEKAKPEKNHDQIAVVHPHDKNICIH